MEPNPTVEELTARVAELEHRIAGLRSLLEEIVSNVSEDPEAEQRPFDHRNHATQLRVIRNLCWGLLRLMDREP